MKKTAIFGASGTLGKEICKLGKFTSPTHFEVDVTNYSEIKGFLEENEEITQILHLAAIVGAKECEENKEKTFLTNVKGTENVSKACLEYGKKLIYLSTDTIFDGQKGNYSEGDIPNPINYYSLTKFAGECFAMMVPSYLIIRTSFFPNEGFPYNKAFIDQYTSRIPADKLAKEIILALGKNLEGILHIGGERDTLYNIVKKGKPDIGKMLRKDTGLNLPEDLSLNTSKWNKIKNES